MLRRFEGPPRATGGKRPPPLSRITSHMSDPYFSRGGNVVCTALCGWWTQKLS